LIAVIKREKKEKKKQYTMDFSQAQYNGFFLGPHLWAIFKSGPRLLLKWVHCAPPGQISTRELKRASQ
jgi:hypothetical protein